ncbi:MAG: vWA domain-containing protein [Brevinema sp.]
MNFENPWYLLFLLAIPLYVILKYTRIFRKYHKDAVFPYPWISLVRKDNFAPAFRILHDILILSSVACLAIALSRPRGGTSITDERATGVDIVVVHDVSGSMDFVDEPPANLRRQGDHFFDIDGSLKDKSRISSAKRAIKKYIDLQDQNRIALVLFGTYALTKSPLSSDKELIKTLIDEIGTFVDGATAIGTGILTGLNRIKSSEAKSKVMILVTDGVNNAGIVDPLTAAKAARELGVRIYTIGFGNHNAYLAPVNQERTVYTLGNTVEFNDEVLVQIADITGGRYFSAQGETALQDVYTEIDKLEKSEYNIRRRVLYEEKFSGWLIAAFTLFCLWIGVGTIVLRIP